MAAPRGEFSSKLGFIMAAAGSAVGLGNIWGFPKEVASNGGAAFLMIYLAMAFLIAYPALMAELIIGRHAKANPVEALKKIGNSDTSRTVGVVTGALWARQIHGSFWTGTSHETWCLLAWAIYAVLVTLRFGARLPARRCAVSAAAGFVFAGFAVLGVELFT